MYSTERYPALFTRTTFHPTDSMETTLIASLVDPTSLRNYFVRELEQRLERQQMEMVFGQDVTSKGVLSTKGTSLPDSDTGIALLQRVLEVTGKSGFGHAGSLSIRLNGSGSAIQEITLSFQSPMGTSGRDSNGGLTPNIVIPTGPNTVHHEGNLNYNTAPTPVVTHS
jgi:hypothetical protein